MPSGSDERVRRTLHFFFILLKFGQDLSGENEECLPLSSRIQEMVEVNDCINLSLPDMCTFGPYFLENSNSDLLACIVVVVGKNERLPRFLVTDQFQLILVEPDKRRLGWAIVRFVCFLQDVQMTGTDSRTLHVAVEDVKTRVNPSSKPILDANLIFDDHIRCMAAKQRLNRGKKYSRTFKLGLIAELFGMRIEPQTEHSSTISVFPTAAGHSAGERRGITPGSVHKLHSPIDAVPPDPEPGRSLPGTIHNV